MPSYQTISDEKSSLLRADLVRQHPELASSPLIIEHHHDGGRCACEPIRNYRKNRSGCCAKLCRFFFWVVVGVFALVFVLRHTGQRGRFSNYWGFGAPGELPVSIGQCSSASIPYQAGDLTYAFDVAADGNPKGFHFAQHWVSNKKPSSVPNLVQTAGQVIVQAAAPGSAPVTVDLDVKLSHAELADAIFIKQEPAGLVFQSQSFLKGLVGEPCISVVATISVAPYTNVSYFDIDTIVLPVTLKDSLRLIADNIFIHSTAGSIVSESSSLVPRKIELETTSSSISGSFPLSSLLSANTVSGAVDIQVVPVESEEAGVLAVRTSSGDITVDTATSSIPNRNFTTQVHTLSGSISGKYLLGVNSNINSASGSIDADFHTAGDVLKRSVTVNSVSGSVKSQIFDDYKLENVFSNFQSQTGLVDVLFPASWEGQIQGKTKTGSIEIVGDGVQIIKDVRPVPGFGRIVVAEKGVGKSSLMAETFNGDIRVKFE